MVNAEAVNGNVMATANYGSGSPSMAAAWAKQVKDSGYPVSSFEIGNEPYGCGSIIIPLTKPPVNDTGYEPNDPATCPYDVYGSVAAGLKVMGQSYLTYAPAFINAIKAADPGVKIELPYAISPKGNSGYVWNDTVMPVLKNYDGIVVLWYPSNDSTSLGAAAALNSVRYIPGEASAVLKDIKTYSPGKPWQIGEENMSNKANTDVCTPTGAVFAAASSLAWLSYGASNVNWWEQSDNNNSHGSCAVADYAMFDGSGVPQPPYFGYWMASRLAQPHAELFKLVDTGYQQEYESELRGGHRAYAYVNLSVSASRVMTVPSTAAYTTYRISTASSHVLTGHVTGAKVLTVPAGTVIVLSR
jgi:hypothetical protein